jgi:hypothetical protein
MNVLKLEQSFLANKAEGKDPSERAEEKRDRNEPPITDNSVSKTHARHQEIGARLR